MQMHLEKQYVFFKKKNIFVEYSIFYANYLLKFKICLLKPIGLTTLVLKPILILKTAIFILKNKYFVAILLLIYLDLLEKQYFIH
jgi:hypothetical protein